MVLRSFSHLRVWIAEGLLVESNWFWSTNVLKSDLFHFKGWFAKGKWLALCACIWFFDRGKLVIRCRSQVTKVVKRTRNGFGKLTPYSAVPSSLKKKFKISQFGARVAGRYETLHTVLEEGEEEFIPLGMVTFISSVRTPFLCQ